MLSKFWIASTLVFALGGTGIANAHSFCNKTPYAIDAAFAYSDSNGLFSNSYTVRFSAWHKLEPNKCMMAPIIYKGGDPAIGELRYVAFTSKDSGAPEGRILEWVDSARGLFGTRNPSICIFDSASREWPIQEEVDVQACEQAGGMHYYMRSQMLHSFDNFERWSHIDDGWTDIIE